MKQWDVFLYPYPSQADPHYFVILSQDSLCQNSTVARVNGLACQTVRPANRPARPFEVYLDRADGFDWKTLVRCHFIYDLDKAMILGPRKGMITPARIQEIRSKLRAIF